MIGQRVWVPHQWKVKTVNGSIGRGELMFPDPVENPEPCPKCGEQLFALIRLMPELLGFPADAVGIVEKIECHKCDYIRQPNGGSIP